MSEIYGDAIELWQTIKKQTFLSCLHLYFLIVMMFKSTLFSSKKFSKMEIRLANRYLVRKMKSKIC